MPNEGEIGKRLLPSLIDWLAQNEPQRVWASVPINDNDLGKGYEDISFRQFANAINHAARWLRDNIEILHTSASARFQTIAYAGPKDLRYALLAVAAVKCGAKLLLASPFATIEAQKHLLEKTNCKTYLVAEASKPALQSLFFTLPDLQVVAVPESDAWLRGGSADPLEYDKAWEEAKSDPWIIFHTSGTTGLPKPVVYTNLMMTSFDAAQLIPQDPFPSLGHFVQNSRCFTPLPALHFVGMTIALQFPAFLNCTLVQGHFQRLDVKTVIEVLKYGKADGAFLAPSLIQDLTRHPSGLAQLRRLSYIFFAGAPLPRHVAEQLSEYCVLAPAFGSTEAGAYFNCVRSEADDWEWYSFPPAMGLEFEQRADNLHELIFRRRPGLARWQQPFHVYPDLTEFHTNDLWAKHPVRAGLWKYMGRVDDVVILSHGEYMYASGMEAEIQKHPLVRLALIGGEARPKPFLIIELVDQDSGGGDSHILKTIWSAAESANRMCSEYVRLTPELVVFTDAARPLVRSAKGTPLRQQSFLLYKDEIEKLYDG